ncbi:MAG: hypothetical protein IKI11_09405 [Neisseriaceae bacterium]|nr:hypothetical protein [Neisseriaceae bacterium]
MREVKIQSKRYLNIFVLPDKAKRNNCSLLTTHCSLFSGCLKRSSTSRKAKLKKLATDLWRENLQIIGENEMNLMSCLWRIVGDFLEEL